jgi:hypothetical protein
MVIHVKKQKEKVENSLKSAATRMQQQEQVAQARIVKQQQQQQALGDPTGASEKDPDIIKHLLPDSTLPKFSDAFRMQTLTAHTIEEQGQVFTCDQPYIILCGSSDTLSAKVLGVPSTHLVRSDAVNSQLTKLKEVMQNFCAIALSEPRPACSFVCQPDSLSVHASICCRTHKTQ